MTEIKSEDYKYDVALSFSGDDREYVEAVAEVLKENEVSVFYDMFEQIDLWGKDLGVHFDYVYRKAARYCIPFISKSYKEKIWTKHEIKTAISRSINSNEEYILPARFDETEIEGIRPTIGFVNLSNLEPVEFAIMIMKKLSKESSIPIAKKEQINSGQIHFSIRVLTDTNLNTLKGTTLSVSITNTNKEFRYFNRPVFKLSEKFNGVDTFTPLQTIVPTKFPAKLEYGQLLDVDFKIYKESLELMWRKINGETKVKVIVTTTLGEVYESNAILVSEIIKSIELSM